MRLSTLDGIIIGLSSIIGSGLFFLPVVVARLSPTGAILPWFLVAIILIPFLRIFFLLSTLHPGASGILAPIKEVFGVYAKNFLCILILCATSIGIPSAAYVAANYLSMLLPKTSSIVPVLTFSLVFIAWLQNWNGIKLAMNIQKFIIGMAVISLIYFLFSERECLTLQAPDLSLISWLKSFSIVPVTFWAYSGWENLSFLSNRFERPQKQISIIMVVTLIVSMVIYALFSQIALHRLGNSGVEGLAGFSSIYLTNGLLFSELPLVVFLLAASASLLIWSNLSVWIMGLSEMCRELLPIKTPNNQVSLLVLLMGYSIGTTLVLVGTTYRDFLVTNVSASFLVTYFVCTLCFLKISRNLLDRGIGLVATVVLGICLIAAGSGLFLSLIVLVLYSIYIYNKKNGVLFNPKVNLK